MKPTQLMLNFMTKKAVRNTAYSFKKEADLLQKRAEHLKKLST
jgi:hypothetical protein